MSDSLTEDSLCRYTNSSLTQLSLFKCFVVARLAFKLDVRHFSTL